MKLAVKKAWVRALRSGKYKQGQNRLRTADNKFCCLGVLCDVYNKTLKRSQWRKIGERRVDWGFGNTQEASSLPPAVQKWAGLNSDDPVINYPAKDGHSVAASSANDNLGYGFKRIASLIEKNL